MGEARHISEVREMAYNRDPLWKHKVEIMLPSRIPGFSFEDVLHVSRRLETLSPILDMVTEAQERPQANSHWYYFMNDDVAAFTASFTEFGDMLALQYFMEWRRLQINEDGSYNAPVYYKRSVFVNFYDETDANVLSLKLKGCFISHLTIPDLTYSATEPVTIDVELTYDETEMTFGF